MQSRKLSFFWILLTISAILLLNVQLAAPREQIQELPIPNPILLAKPIPSVMDNIVVPADGQLKPAAYDIDLDPFFADSCFIGDSFTNGLEGYTRLKQQAVFLDEVGMTVAKAEARLSELSQITPKRIFLLLGINDMGYGYSPQEFAAQYQQLLTKLQTNWPQAKIYAQAIFHVTAGHESFDSCHTNAAIAAYNAALAGVCRQSGFAYLDIASAFCDQAGVMREAESPDGMHLEYSGHFVWLELLKQIVLDYET
ncbi:MAG: GDSL-type esterase/lipase family protein [Negativicutes bacterium]|nr:GDSL-type esterase/lipase family protein [Negativicutes bacterium]